MSNGLLMRAPNVSRDHVDPAVPQLIADLPPSLTIKVPIYLATASGIDRRVVLGDLLITLNRVRRS